ncbi:hypothetical protein [Acinetobacter sp. TR11]|uniref:hypothetical protein n=1 Tax=Acinetobacter sp. TR11 TaxID=3003393 RepID=UPI0022AC27F3|nr:hypothetical protein [Acinetobacter sp. TR11]WAU72405.1 hypothetical protein O1450_09760 [Acinetobacter sp. TR11]
MSNLTEHKCAGKCPEFKGEQCHHCLIPGNSEISNSSDFIMGDDAHIENHISPLCLSDSRKNESKSPWSIKEDALSRMESHYIEQKKQVELLKTEKLAMQAEIDEQGNRTDELAETCLNFEKQINDVLKIINHPDNYYLPFYCVAEQIQAVLGEVVV